MRFCKRAICVTIFASLFAIACSTPSPRGSKNVSFAGGKEGKVTESQLQEELFRFANRFSAGTREGLAEAESSSDPKIRQEALLRRLSYNSAALDICLGPSPEANLLDMIVFIELSRSVWDEVWASRIFKAQTSSMTREFAQASEEIWKIATQVLDSPQRTRLAALIHQWRELNPTQLYVENVRFSEFATEIGHRSKEMEREIGGIGASIQGATVVGDRAVLLSERALFYAQRAPFLWRLQAQVGLHDALSEVLALLSSGKGLLANEPQLRATLSEFNETIEASARLLSIVAKHPEVIDNASTGLGHFADSLRELNRLSANDHLKGVPSQLAGVAASVDTRAEKFLWELFFLGCGLIILLGLVLLASRLLYWRLTRDRPTRRMKDVSDDRGAA